MTNIYRLPMHKTPILHDDAVLISYEKCYQLGKIYKEIIGVDNIHHFSLNVVDHNGKMLILSYKPQIAYNIFKDGTYRYNGSISPTYYDNKDHYSWDETYHPNYYHQLKNNMERKNGIDKGVVLVKRVGGLTLLYSFATKINGVDFMQALLEQKEHFYSIGDHCFEQISPILQNYSIGLDNSPIEFDSNVIEFKKNV